MDRGAWADPPVSSLPELVPAGVAPPGRAAVARAVIAVGLVVGWALSLTQPVEQSVERLLRALDDGRVTELTIERTPGLPGAQAAGEFRVEWSAGLRDAYAFYELDTMTEPEVDEGQSSSTRSTPRRRRCR